MTVTEPSKDERRVRDPRGPHDGNDDNDHARRASVGGADCRRRRSSVASGRTDFGSEEDRGGRFSTGVGPNRRKIRESHRNASVSSGGQNGIRKFDSRERVDITENRLGPCVGARCGVAYVRQNDDNLLLRVNYDVRVGVVGKIDQITVSIAIRIPR